MKKINKIEKIRHSLAHLLAIAILDIFPNAKLGIGPIIENGFYYDFDLPESLTPEQLPKIEEKMREFIKIDLLFKKETIGFAKTKMMFKNEPYKLELIKELNKNKKEITVYKTFKKSAISKNDVVRDVNSMFHDLCAGPHIESTKEIDPAAFKLTKIAGAYWKGDEKNKMLTRIYGVAFDSEKELKQYIEILEETEKRDHKKLGKELELFMFHETSPGMPYWLPKGLIIYNELVKYWREKHQKENYREISTPLINKAELWKISGHWEHYKEDMFIANMGENEIYGVKPMNCPNAMIVFKSKLRSYKDLPLRFSDTDRLHRYEKSGTLNGLLRVRSFQQDDSHNFISEEMIGEEYENIFRLCEEFYGIFNLEYSFRLGTRPIKFMGDKKIWNKAEKTLKEILEKTGKKYCVAKGDGAFYGPKIDILMKDCLNREWQLGTIQLDFQIPLNFKLEYVDKNGKNKTPVVVHRVIYGSLERFIGILIEHCAGAFPAWLSPVQARIIPISEKFNEYGNTVLKNLEQSGIRTELDDNNETLGKKIREGEKQKIPYLLIVGAKETQNETVGIRERKKGNIGEMNINEFLKKIKNEIDNKKM